jgi:hypothetical protein
VNRIRERGTGSPELVHSGNPRVDRVGGCMYNPVRFCLGGKVAKADVRNPSFPGSRRRLMQARGLSGEVNAWRLL